MAVQPNAVDGVVTLTAPQIPTDVEYTLTFWFRVGQVDGDTQYVASVGGEAGGLSVYQEATGILTVHDEVVNSVEIPAPEADEWVFGAMVISGTAKQFKWATACDEEFAAENLAEIDSNVSITEAALGNDATLSPSQPNINGAHALARQWTRALTDEELLAEKASLTAVLSDDLWSSNPLATDTDDSDESGNDNVATLTNVATVDDPNLECQEDGVVYNCDCDDQTGYDTLLELRRRMMVRLGYAAQAASPPPGMAAFLTDQLQSAQRFLYRKYNALRTERFYTWTMEPGIRMYDIPENEEVCTKRLDAYKVTWVGVEDLNGTWLELVEGINPTLYTSVQHRGLPGRYEIRQCIEVFPAPAEAYKLRVKGHFGLEAFTADDDQTTIDSELVFLWALANAKNHYGQPDAKDIASQAREYLLSLVAGTHHTARYVPGTQQATSVPRPIFLPTQGE